MLARKRLGNHGGRRTRVCGGGTSRDVSTEPSGGIRKCQSNIYRMFHSLCTRADVPQLRVHDLRHSCATLLFTMGVPPATVQRILRHSSISVTTGTYVEVIEAVQRDALDSMGTLFEQVGDDSSGRLSSMKPRLSSRLSSKARESGP
jgi:integrase